MECPQLLFRQSLDYESNIWVLYKEDYFNVEDKNNGQEKGGTHSHDIFSSSIISLCLFRHILATVERCLLIM